MVADIAAIVGKVSYDLSLRRRELIKSSLKPEFRSLCSANNEPTELLFGDDLTKHVKDLTMTNKLKRSESYYQSKYSNNKYSKYYTKSYSRQQKSPPRPEQQVSRNINSSTKGKFKTVLKIFMEGKFLNIKK